VASNHSAERSDRAAASAITVVVAGLANLAVAIAKAVGALLSGSAAMLSEAAHSVADTVTEVMLFVAVRRGERPADEKHPFGHGRETYLWAMLAALATFTAGSAVSIFEGIAKLHQAGPPGDVRVSFVILALAFVIEGASLLRGIGQVRGNARRWRMHPISYLRVTTDTPLKAVTLEDAAALIGLVLAAIGLELSRVTGSSAWDGIASILIGLLLAGVAILLLWANSELLVGRPAPKRLIAALRRELESLPEVLSVPLLLTAVLGPERLLVAAKVEFADQLTADEIERVADEAERRFVALHPGVEYVFLDPTGAATRHARSERAQLPSERDSSTDRNTSPQAP
jgi:cation diffusion facilitator family transporter